MNTVQICSQATVQFSSHNLLKKWSENAPKYSVFHSLIELINQIWTPGVYDAFSVVV